jgi:hypothetical protein
MKTVGTSPTARGFRHSQRAAGFIPAALPQKHLALPPQHRYTPVVAVLIAFPVTVVLAEDAAGINRGPQTFGGPPNRRGAYFSMADGSARLIAEDVDLEVLKTLSTPADNDAPAVPTSASSTDKLSEPRGSSPRPSHRKSGQK